jgi:hypothetical protein
VASTSLGSNRCDQLRAQVFAEQLAPKHQAEATLRLIVQSYDPAGLDRDGRPKPHARPLSSAQRSVSAEDLARGVYVDLVQLDGEADDELTVVAWIESGEADLEYDALGARPQGALIYGEATALDGGRRQVILRRKQTLVAA